jgi:hypothetical protein
VNGSVLNRLALETGDAHFSDVFKSYQNIYTWKVLEECYQVFQNSQQPSKEYLAIDFLFDIQKHFGIEFKSLDKGTD